MTNPLAKMSGRQLKRAVAIREKMQTLESELDQLAGGQSASEKKSDARKNGKAK
jgi:hypothetical protein